MDIKAIRSNFNKSSHTYDKVASVQLRSARLLAEKLYMLYPNFIPETVLDVGAGTGIATEQLLKYYPNSEYILNDIAPNMLCEARNKFASNKNVKLLEGDMEQLSLENHDLIISNFALHWGKNPKALVERLIENSKVMAFSWPVQGTFDEWIALCRTLDISIPHFPYLSPKQLIRYCLRSNPQSYHFEYKKFSLRFASLKGFFKYIKALGVGVPSSLQDRTNLIRLIKCYDKPIIISYKVLLSFIER